MSAVLNKMCVICAVVFMLAGTMHNIKSANMVTVFSDAATNSG